MSKFREELNVIPLVARVLAAVGYLGAVTAVGFIVKQADDGPWLFWAFLAIFPPLFFASWILLIGYVNGDARRRGMRHVLWTLLAIFIPNAIGIILYFILRDPLMVYCSRCGAGVHPSHAFCPKCGSGVQPSCRQCHRTIQPGWSHCAWCGQTL